MKNGEGKYFYFDKGHLYIGWWLNNVPKCGSFEEFRHIESSDQVTSQFPKCDLVSPDDVLTSTKMLLLNP